MLWHGASNGCGLWLPDDKTANMWHGRENGCGSWLPEDKTANMWHGRKTVVQLLAARLPPLST